MTTPGFIYARQSKTREGSESLDIQVTVCREAAARLGIEIVEEFVEPPSTSGYKHRGRNRPKFGEMLQAVRTGKGRAILVYKSERLSRGGGPGWAPVFDALEAADINVDKAIATPNGWMSEFEISIRAAMDREESKKLADRMSDVREREAKAGRPQPGGRRPFGYEADCITVREVEANLVREAAGRILDGESAWGICKSWNERSVTGPGGNHWNSQSLKRILTSGRVGGFREHLGTVSAEATWPALLDADTWGRVRALLAGRKTPRGRPVRSFPLTGIARCGKCGATLSGRTRNGGRREYICFSAQSHSNQAACGGLAIFADATEADVFEVIAGTLLDPVTMRRMLAVVPSEGIEAGPDLGAEIGDLEGRKARLLDLYESGDLDKSEYRRRMAELTGRLDEIRSELGRKSERPVLASIPTTETELREAWATRGIDWQRLVINAVVERLVVRGGRAPKPADRLVYTLRAA